MNLSDLQTSLISLAQKTGAAILEIYNTNQQYQIQTKPDHSPLTQADLIAHQTLVTGLKALTPNLPILSEEGSNIPWQERQTWSRYWLIDPLDGTRQFIRHKDEFTVNIALIDHHQPILGLLYVPITGETYYADAEEKIAYKITGQQKIPLHVRSWQSNQTIILTSQAAKEQRLRDLFGHLGDFTQIRMSSAWKFARLAEGAADISPRFGDTSEWDTAAGQCILEQAGGALVDLQGQSLRYNTRDSLINPHFIALGDAKMLYKKLAWPICLPHD